jgi:hypothetical protein
MVRISLVPVLTPLYLYVSTFRSMCAVPSMAVFCSSLTLWFPGMLLTYFLNYFEMVPVTPLLLLLLTGGEGKEHLLVLQWLSPFKTACHQQYKHANNVNF